MFFDKFLGIWFDIIFKMVDVLPEMPERTWDVFDMPLVGDAIFFLNHLVDVQALVWNTIAILLVMNAVLIWSVGVWLYNKVRGAG